MRYTYFVLFLFAFPGAGCSAPQAPAATAVPVQPTAAVAATAVVVEPTAIMVEQLDALAIALQADDVPSAITLSDTVHDAQHDLSQAIDQWLGGEAVDH